MSFSQYSKSEKEKLLSQFAQSIISCSSNGNYEESYVYDMPEIVVILQSLGFHLRRIDICNSKEVTPLIVGNQGVKAIISCTRSGQRCFLELTSEIQDCTCVKLPEECPKDNFWEVTATTSQFNKSSSFVESGSALIPRLPKDVQILMKLILNYFANVINGKTDLNQNINCSYKRNQVKHNTSMNSIPDTVPLATSSIMDLREGAGNRTPPKYFDCFSRYRSLDALTSHNGPKELPEPVTLKKIATPQRKPRPSITQSSPNIKLAAENIDNSQFVAGKSEYEDVKNILRDATVLLHKALFLLEDNTANDSKTNKLSKEKNDRIAKFFEETLNRNSYTSSQVKKSFGSSPLLSQKPYNKRQLQLPTTASHSNLFRNKLPSTSSIATVQANTSKMNASKITMSASKIQNGTASSNGSTTKLKRTNLLYGHIKSTIPKLSSAKKELNKKF